MVEALFGIGYLAFIFGMASLIWRANEKDRSNQCTTRKKKYS